MEDKIKSLIDRLVSVRYGVDLLSVKRHSMFKDDVYRYYDSALGQHQEFLIMIAHHNVRNNERVAVCPRIFRKMRKLSIYTLLIMRGAESIHSVYLSAHHAPQNWEKIYLADGTPVYIPKC